MGWGAGSHTLESERVPQAHARLPVRLETRLRRFRVHYMLLPVASSTCERPHPCDSLKMGRRFKCRDRCARLASRGKAEEGSSRVAVRRQQTERRRETEALVRRRRRSDKPAREVVLSTNDRQSVTRCSSAHERTLQHRSEQCRGRLEAQARGEHLLPPAPRVLTSSNAIVHSSSAQSRR
jgi:hypothetical protein